MIKVKIEANGYIELDAGYEILNIGMTVNGRVRVTYNADYDSPIMVKVAKIEIGESPEFDFEYVGVIDGDIYIYIKDCDLQDQLAHANTRA